MRFDFIHRGCGSKPNCHACHITLVVCFFFFFLPKIRSGAFPRFTGAKKAVRYVKSSRHISCSEPFHVCSIRYLKCLYLFTHHFPHLGSVKLLPAVSYHQYTFSYMHTVNEHNYAILHVAFTRQKVIYSPLH